MSALVFPEAGRDVDACRHPARLRPQVYVGSAYLARRWALGNQWQSVGRGTHIRENRMDKVTLIGSLYRVPPNLCVSCNGSSLPKTFITASFEGHSLSVPILIFDLWVEVKKPKERRFPFPACEHCAESHEDFAKRVKRFRVVLSVLLLMGIIAYFCLALTFFQKPYGESISNLWIIAVGMILIIVGQPVVRPLAEWLAKRAIGDQSPPLYGVRVTKSFFGDTWTFRFENDDYAAAFRTLNVERLRS